MKFSVFTVVGAIAAGAAALPASVPHVVHEKSHGPGGWAVVEGIKPNPDMTLPLRIGLVQNNLDMGYDYLMDVADPTSENYSKHWTVKQVRRDHNYLRLLDANLIRSLIPLPQAKNPSMLSSDGS